MPNETDTALLLDGRSTTGQEREIEVRTFDDGAAFIKISTPTKRVGMMLSPDQREQLKEVL